jgi:phage terminase large subunit-like protein
VVKSWPPLILTPVPADDIARGDGPVICETVETFCRVSKDGFAGRGGELIRLRPWQRMLLGHAFARRADGRLRHKVILILMPRKNGKSAIGSGLGVDGLLFGGRGAEVYSCAGDRDQARIIFGEGKNMISADPDLRSVLQPMRDVIAGPHNSIWRVLSAEAYSKEGLNPTRVLFDEAHVQPNRELFDVMDLAMGARVDAQMIVLSTVGVKVATNGEESLLYQLYQYGRRVAAGEIDDPTFFMAYWGAPEGADHRDPKVWDGANPGYGDLIDPEDFAAKVNTTPENEYRIKRLNQWVETTSAFLPTGAWEALADRNRSIPDHAQVVLTFDGSYGGSDRADSTGIVVTTIGDDPFLDVVDCWEAPTLSGRQDMDWHVPIEDVEDAIRAACRRWKVREVDCDPFRWARSMQILERERIPIVEFPQSDARMIPATEQFFEAVTNGRLRHSGDPRLGRHMGSARTKITSRGSRVVKESKGSRRHVDLAVCAVMGVATASRLKPRTSRVIDLNALARADGPRR